MSDLNLNRFLQVKELTRVLSKIDWSNIKKQLGIAGQSLALPLMPLVTNGEVPTWVKLLGTICLSSLAIAGLTGLIAAVNSRSNWKGKDK